LEEGDFEKLLRRNIKDLTVSGVSDFWREEPSTVTTGDPVWKMVSALVERPKNRTVYVLDASGKLLGMISFRDILRITNARLGARTEGPVGLLRYMRDLLRDDVDSLMRKPIHVKSSTPFLEALRKMEDVKMNDMPVVDEAGNLVGELSGLKILRYSLEEVRRGDEAAAALKKEQSSGD